MFKIILAIVILFISSNILAQQSFTTIIKDSSTNKVLAGATVLVKGKKITAISDSTGGINILNIPAGKQILIISFVGYEKRELEITFPKNDSNQIAFIFLAKEAETELEEVVVQSTRTSRTINNTPTRVETIDLEEIDEKSNMKPANVSMILHESTGIQVQQTSATSGNASIRIQGLDGRYTQLLKDGYAAFGNFASGLSILEIPPLDLKQVEIIKGPASTLYGAGAIAGVVNFISKTPKEKLNVNIILNQSNVGQTNVGVFAIQRNKKLGFSMLALFNNQNKYDVDKDDFTELPTSTDFTLHPKLFFYPTDNTSIIIGNSFSKGNRLGGDVYVLNDKADAYHTYFEKNNTTRSTTTLEISQKFKNSDKLIIKSSISYFERNIAIPTYRFSGVNNNYFNDVSYFKNTKNQTFIVGANFIIDKFKEQQASTVLLRNFSTNTFGVYAQHTWDATEKLKLETGIRIDRANFFNLVYEKTEYFFLPRISFLYKFNDKWSSRIGAGLGYKTPTIFTEVTETNQYQNILPLNNVSSERSTGATADVNFKSKIGEHINFSANQLFFYTNIKNSAVLLQNSSANFYFANTNMPVESLGFETNLKFVYKENFKLFVGYTYTDAKAKYLSGNQFLLLLPKSKLNLALVYEVEDKIKVGLEGYFTGKQYLANGSITPSFAEFGFMAEKIFSKFSVFINAENFTDVRQSRYKRVVNEPHSNPSFDDIWTHTEGRTYNAGVKFKM